MMIRLVHYTYASCMENYFTSFWSCIDIHFTSFRSCIEVHFTSFCFRVDIHFTSFCSRIDIHFTFFWSFIEIHFTCFWSCIEIHLTGFWLPEYITGGSFFFPLKPRHQPELLVVSISGQRKHFSQTFKIYMANTKSFAFKLGAL
ncbi:hypothetical protein CROQUDRAFT_201026 [Cronartium quercuum f. sp. fusiforme G11]|uniref:Uncharacterized protein n=1 Tax=Cronartium quercuum f. sp. fusiforme G11 TaxID=708437 RepID=A0A9P6NFL0_9BASI|nr:hypothetical protein CROQUDRAFT_201026 [Cronartium quercuum f. sp. fusiforme G11]